MACSNSWALLQWNLKYMIIYVMLEIKIYRKSCKSFCRNFKFLHSSAAEYCPTLILSTSAVFQHQHGDACFTRTFTEPSLLWSKTWLLIIDCSHYANWSHFGCQGITRFISDTQCGSLTPIALAESQFFIHHGWEKAHLWSVNLKVKQLHIFWFCKKTPTFPNVYTAIAQCHCVQEPLKGFTSPDNFSEEDRDIAASLLFTIRKACWIKGVWFIYSSV